MTKWKNIPAREETKKRLDKLKVAEGEIYDSILCRLLDCYEKNAKTK